MHNVLKLLFRYFPFSFSSPDQNKNKKTQTFLHHLCLPITVSPIYSNLNIYNDSFTTNGSAH